MSSPCRVERRLAAAAAVAAAALLAGDPADAAAEAPPLRLCVEPANLPFADAAGDGFEVAIARLVAGRLGRELELVPVIQGIHGFARRTLGDGLCDVLTGMPAGAEGALTTQPYYRSTWVFVARAGEPLPASFDDPRLPDWRIAVPVVGEGWDTPPVAALARRGIVQNLRRFPIGAKQPAGPLAAVAAGEADLAIVWGPVAGWYAARHPSVRLAMAPTPAADGDVPFTAATALAVRRGDEPLRKALDDALLQEGEAVAAILAAWHIPLAEGG
jgi:mxaJ protein